MFCAQGFHSEVVHLPAAMQCNDDLLFYEVIEDRGGVIDEFADL